MKAVMAMMQHGNASEQPHDGSSHAQPVQPAVSSALPTFESVAHTDATPPSGVSAEELAKAMQLVERKRSRGKIARRVLIGAAAAGLCAGAVELGPTVLQKAGEYTKSELQDAFNSGVEAGRQALLAELAQIEGVTLEGAIGIAKLTQLGIQYVVMPLARLATTIEGDALQVLTDAVSTARTNLAHFNVNVPWLDSLQTLLSTWRDNVQQLPESLNTYATTDITAAEMYLAALQAKIRAEQSAQPTPSPTK